MKPAYSEIKQKKKPTNLSVPVELLEMAHADNLNLSGMLVETLIEYRRKKREREWLEQNKKAISDMNRYVEEYGVFSDGRRLF